MNSTTTNPDFINLYCTKSMEACALHLGTKPADLDYNRLTETLRAVVKDRLPKFLEEMESIVMDDTPMAIDKEAYLRKILNAEVNAVAVETLKKYGA